MAELQIDSHIESGLPTITLAGELDSYSAPRLHQIVARLIADQHHQLIFDVRRVEYIDSSGLGVLIGALKQVLEHEGTVCLVCPSPPVERVLSVTGLDRLFPIFNDEAEAKTRLTSV